MSHTVKVAKHSLFGSQRVGMKGYLVHSMGVNDHAGYDSWSLDPFLPIGFDNGAHIKPYQADIAANIVRVNHGHFEVVGEDDDLWVLEPRPSYHDQPILPKGGSAATTEPFVVEALNREGGWGTELIGGDDDLARCHTLDEARDLVSSLIADQCREDEPLELRIVQTHQSGEEIVVERFPAHRGGRS